MPYKTVYDFTKRSTNYKMMTEGIFDQYECERRCDSKILENDLKVLEIELKKKQEKRIKKDKKEAE